MKLDKYIKDVVKSLDLDLDLDSGNNVYGNIEVNNNDYNKIIRDDEDEYYIQNGLRPPADWESLIIWIWKI
jgi:hypothetical protein